MDELVKDQYVHVDGVKLAVRDRGNGPALLLINGTAPPLWGSLPELLRESHRVVEYDRRSFMGSPAVPPRDPRRHAEDAAELLGQMNAAPALVVGWSMGAIVAVDLACRHPHLISGLVLLEPPFRAKQHPRPAMLGAVGFATLLGRFGRPSSGAERFLRWALARSDGSSAYFDASADWRAEVRRNGTAIVSELSAGEHLDRAAVSELGVPATVVTGGLSDPVFRVAARRLSDVMPAAEFVTVPGSGHALPFDAAPAVAEIVQRRAAASPRS